MSISVVIAYYNRPKHLDEALESVFRQTRPADEVIVVDDGSRPEAAEHLRRHEARARILHYENRGVSVALNRGIAAATSDWMAFLDDDDAWAPRRLEILSQYVAAHPECELVHNAIYILGTNRIIRKRPVSLEDFLFSTPGPISGTSIMVKRKLLLHLGLFNPVLKTTHDHDLYMRLIAFRRCHYVDEPLTGIRVGVREGSPGVMMTRRQRLYYDVNRVWAYYQGLYPDERRRRDFAAHVNASQLVKSLYEREWPAALDVLVNNCPIQGISRVRVIGRALGMIAQNRLRR